MTKSTLAITAIALNICFLSTAGFTAEPATEIVSLNSLESAQNNLEENCIETRDNTGRYAWRCLFTGKLWHSRESCIWYCR